MGIGKSVGISTAYYLLISTIEAQRLGSAVNKVNNEQRGELVGQKTNVTTDAIGIANVKGTRVKCF